MEAPAQKPPRRPGAGVCFGELVFDVKDRPNRGPRGRSRARRHAHLLPLNKSLCIRTFNRLTHSLAASSAVLTQKPEMSEPPLYS